MIDRLIAGLGDAAKALTAETIAEALWLAEHLPAAQSDPESRPPAPSVVGKGESPPAPPTEVRRPPGQPTGQTGWSPGMLGRPGTAQMYLAGDDREATAGEALAAGSPAVPALPHALTLARALGPLRRAVGAQREQELDEERTVEMTAETGMPQLVFAPSRDRWLDLVIVVDESPSMVVWGSTVAEMVDLAGRLNAFGSVRVWRIRPDRAGLAPVLSAGTTQAPRDPRELIDPAGRRLILVFSDCTAAMWDSAQIRSWLELWGMAGPVAIIQPLPQRLWHRCRPQLHPVSMHPPFPGAQMAQMHPVPWDETTIPPGAVAIPVLELAAPWLATGARLIAARTARPVRTVAMLTRDPSGDAPKPDEDRDDPAGSDGVAELSGAEQVRAFQASASPNARHLAEFLAAAPLTLPVMRLVQRLTLPDSVPQDLAEVFLSGLLFRVTPEDRPMPADRVLYDFRKDVRAALLTGLRAGEALELLDEVSQFVNQRMGTSFDFPALLAGDEGGVPPTELGQPFAAVAREVLIALGGRYAALAERLLPVPDGDLVDDPDLPYQPHSRLTGRTKGEDVTQQTDEHGGGGPGTIRRPAVWGDVPPRNPDFTGREVMLRNLRRQLTNRVTALLPHALHGLGGVGKTQLAVEYAYRFDYEYDLVWWVPAEQPALLRQSLMALARRLDLVPVGEENVSRALANVSDALRTGRPYRRWLLVFDNANRPEDLSPFLSNPGGHLLITSRNYNWAGIAQAVEVDVFSRTESIELLRRRLPTVREEDADRLADLLGDLPLALEQAASWILATAMPFAEYTDLLEKRTVDALREGTPSTYNTPVAVVFGLSFERLAEQNPPAVQLLELCAFFGPEPISIRLLPQGRFATNLPPVLQATVRDDIELRRAVRDIGRFGLAKVDPTRNSIQVHRLVQAVLRDRLTEQQQETYRTSVQEILAAYNPGDPTDDPTTWDRHAEIGPHVAASRAVLSDRPDIRNVVLDQIRYLYVTGDYDSSRELGQIAHERWAETLGAGNALTIVTSRFLGNAMRATGDSSTARELNARTLEIARRSLGEDHEHTLAIANSVGGDLRLSGDWDRSKALDQDLLARHRRVFGEDDPNTLRVANNLGVDLRLLGEFQPAYELDEDTWRRRRRVLGDEHPDTVFTATVALSRDLYGLGRYYEAIELQRRWLPVLRERLGPNHANVLLASRVHAGSLRRAGQAHEALDLARDMVHRRQDGYGEDHAETLSGMVTLFTIMAQADRITEAKVLGEETLVLLRRAAGEDHTFTYVGMTDLAIVLRMAGDYARARELDENALRGLTGSRVLGSDHPYTICTAVNMSNNLALGRDHHAASRLLSDTLSRARRTLGDNHPDTLACAANLVLDLHAIGDVDVARQLRDDTVDRLRQALKSDHPDIDDVVHGRRLHCVVDPPPV